MIYILLKGGDVVKKENTSVRLNKIMEERNLRQVDILERVKPFCIKYDIKMNKSDLSQYVSGKVEPSQEKLVILGMALNVSEAWLMGFDVPMERTSATREMSPKILQYYEMLNDIGKHKATERVKELAEVPRYVQEDTTYYVNAAHADDYASAPEELKKLEEDIMDDENF